MVKDYRKMAIHMVRVRIYGSEAGMLESDISWLASRLEKADKFDDLKELGKSGNMKVYKDTRVIIYKWKEDGLQSKVGHQVLNIVLDKEESLKIAIGDNVGEPVS